MQSTATQSTPAVLFTWCDIPEGDEPAFTEWYNREHMRDRVLGLPGFKRGRRFVAVKAEPKYLAFYEAHDAAVFRSEEYVKLITTPDPRSHHFIMRFQNTIRTIARMSASLGEGEGAMVMVLPLMPKDGEDGKLRRALVTDIMPQVHAAPGIVAVRLIERDPNANAPSRKGHVRQGDRTVDWALIVEAGESAALDDVARTLLTPQVLEQAGADIAAALPPTPAVFRQLYRVAP